MKLRILGAHHEESKNTRLVTLLINDHLAIDAGCLSAELSFQEQQKISSILLTHEHYDHLKGLPSFIFNNYDRKIDIIATKQTIDIVSLNLFDGVIYPKFTDKTPLIDTPPIHFVEITPFQQLAVEKYQVQAFPVHHTEGSVGFEITSPDKKKIVFTGDTGPGLEDLWKHISPDVMIIDVTFPNSMKTVAQEAGHLCPQLLEKELQSFYQIKEYYPKIIGIHISPKYESIIQKEIHGVAHRLGILISLAHEGQMLTV